MGLFSRIAQRVPRGLAIFTMGFAGIFGIRTPPDPEVVAQTAPAPHPAGGDSHRRFSRTRAGRPPEETDGSLWRNDRDAE
ncbi:MAG: hypothetical protein K0Q72_4138 [Armatimonadetes bacterium]|jgi:hypothetical protein|nr:hypothetical protein [Armatimonadota bacterium]